MCLPELMVSKVVDGTSLGISNFTMPNLSDAEYDEKYLWACSVLENIKSY